jgi:lipopolysaccharide transport system ATP-binding protein
MSTVIKVENLSKLYRLGQVGTGTISHDVNRWWHRIRGKEDPYLKIGETNDRAAKGDSEYVWALKDINFEVKQGEVLGIIGRNGAGKSTLLKILSRTTAPTTGSVKIKGRVASLLEVGTGFHPELSGRDNIFLNGAILGMTRREIQSKFDEIVDFAGVERYIDTPVKRYSSGMYVRLAFAVAAHLEPEILIVDEVLAVGDIEFQKKALGKMKDVSEKGRRTVLFVSHNMASMRSLCTNGILMECGEIAEIGLMKNIINKYERSERDTTKMTWKNLEETSDEVYLEAIEIQKGNNVGYFHNTEEIQIKFNINSKILLEHVKIGFDLLKDGDIVFRSYQVDSLISSTIENGFNSFLCTIPPKLLNEGRYDIKPVFNIHCVRALTLVDYSVVSFEIKNDVSISPYHEILNKSNHPGKIFPFLKWVEL